MGLSVVPLRVLIMFLLPGAPRATISPSDLRVATGCEWALLREFDAVLGRIPRSCAPDPLAPRLAALGAAHEQAVVRALAAEHPGRVVTIARPERHTAAGIADAAAATLDALARPEVEAVCQGAIADDRFLGYADFLVRDPDGRWAVWDAKLARDASVPALLQLAAYGHALQAAGVDLAPDAALVLGAGDREEFPLAEIVPVYLRRRDRLVDLLDRHHDGEAPAQWGEGDVHACGRCPECAEQLAATRDIGLVAGVYTSQRKRLLAAGVATLDDLADREEPVPDLTDAYLAKLRAQARLQRHQRDTGVVSAEVFRPEGIAALPPPSAGDLFFDFEGDPLWSEPGSPLRGLEYLFGVLESSIDGQPGAYRAFWAHDHAAEKQALIDFVGYVVGRRREFPDLHVYHYADYERSRLLGLAARYAVCEAEIDDFLREGVLVDLYAVVRGAVRVSQESYSIKKLEPLYMGADLRGGPVATAGDSIVVYHEFVQAGIEGRVGEAERLLASIRDYNAYDCLSTLRLRHWLLDQLPNAGATDGATDGGAGGGGDQGGIPPSVGERLDAPQRPGSPLWAAAEETEARLRDFLGDTPPHARSADEQALALVTAGLQFNRREAKPFWWRHFDRLRHPLDEWTHHPDVLAVGSATVVRDWFTEGRQRSPRRLLDLTLVRDDDAPTPRVGESLYAVYDAPAPAQFAPESPTVRVAPTTATVTAVMASETGLRVAAEEVLPTRFDRVAEIPVALVPRPGPATTHLDAALLEVGQMCADTWPRLPDTPGLDVLRRRPPRLRTRAELPRLEGSDDYVRAITAAVLDLDDSYLAVQGPPGTGKTYVAAHVIARLVERHGWKVGVVAQSHAAVENVLDAVVRAGLDPYLVGKQSQHRAEPTWTDLPDRQLALFASARSDRGYLLGGTVYDFTHPTRVARGQLDLLVVDEAGQYSLANTVAASLAARRLLLLGDPQQLPEVSQGTHPEPIHGSALGWLVEGRPTLPPERGYFLSTTWRLHPRLAERVSRLAYAGSLAAQPERTTARSLDGIAPGLHLQHVEHRDNTVSSAEEADAVVEIIRDLLGRSWSDPDEGTGARPLSAEDILVVTPHNAQVTRLREALDKAGCKRVRAGTVDKFQGQEGAVVLISMAASARSDVSRGMAFLLDRNRLNVALSRGKWAAYLVCSPELTDFAPRTPAELMLLGSFLRLTEPELTAPELTERELTEPESTERKPVEKRGRPTRGRTAKALPGDPRDQLVFF